MIVEYRNCGGCFSLNCFVHELKLIDICLMDYTDEHSIPRLRFLCSSAIKNLFESRCAENVV